MDNLLIIFTKINLLITVLFIFYSRSGCIVTCVHLSIISLCHWLHHYLSVYQKFYRVTMTLEISYQLTQSWDKTKSVQKKLRSKWEANFAASLGSFSWLTSKICLEEVKVVSKYTFPLDGGLELTKSNFTNQKWINLDLILHFPSHSGRRASAATCLTTFRKRWDFFFLFGRAKQQFFSNILSRILSWYYNPSH